MFAAAKQDDDMDDFYCDGDLAVNWEEADDAAYEDGNSMLLMRNTHSADENTETMGQFYWEHCFDEQLSTLLQQHGFSAAAANAVSDVAGDTLTLPNSTVANARVSMTCVSDDGTNSKWMTTALSTPIATVA